MINATAVPPTTALMLQSVQETGNEIWALHHSKSFVLLFLASTRKNKLKAEKYSKLLINTPPFACPID